MKPPTPLDIVASWNRGQIGRGEFLLQVFAALKPKNAVSFLQSAPAEALMLMRKDARKAPTTDAGWNKTMILFGGTVRRDARSVAAHKRRMVTLKKAHRAGIELFRQLESH